MRVATPSRLGIWNTNLLEVEVEVEVAIFGAQNVSKVQALSRALLGSWHLGHTLL